MNYIQILSDCWAYGTSYLPLCGFPTWAAALLPSLGGGEVISMGTRSFRVVQKLGEGGYAVVYLVSQLATAEHPHPDPELRALKRVLVHSEEHFDAVQQEMFVHSAVQHHPNILPLLDYSCSEGGASGAASAPVPALVIPPAPLPQPAFTLGPAAAATAGAAPSQPVGRDGDVGSIVPQSAVPGASLGRGDRVACFLFPVFRDGTLASELDRLGGAGQLLPTADVLSVFCQLANAVAHINAHGYAHRDIKPLNVLIAINPDHPASRQRQQTQQQRGGLDNAGARGGGGGGRMDVGDLEAGVALTWPRGDSDIGHRYRCVLMDFGSARARRLQAHCSAPYRAPELFDVPSPGSLDFAAADVWALGASLFHVMYGEPPFARAMNAAGGSLALAVLNCAIGWPRPPSPTYPPELHQLVQSAMAPEPSARPSAAQLAEMAAALVLKDLQDPAPQQLGITSGQPKR
ncbi:hypothetical protein Vretimale_1804 [Volvox reticuliferus]|nr:hypothetical protein Vretimale_1804 [Volvox reticuliferus]